ncbi:erythropoietin receptor [Pyxicephalus adspersus]|uniref:erythropoietin receptor n=1 Tax=Pyxicephalus adspersus TaxID=30357 RepID=UPI003B5AED97
MGTLVPILSNVHHCGSLLLVLCLVLCSGGNPILTSEFIHRVNNVIENRTLLPFCFTVELEDLTCFWESDTPDNSKFTFYYKPGVSCDLMTVKASEESWWHLCQFPQDEVNFFAINPQIISVWDNRSNTTLYKRELIPEDVVYTEPPTNITMTEQKRPLGLMISFKNTEQNPILSEGYMYEVNYTSPKGQNSMIFPKSKVRSEGGYVQLFLSDVTRDADYTINVRKKVDNPHDGYWSAWAVTTFQMSDGFDELHILLFVFAGFSALIVIFSVVVYQRRFLKSKVWPDIPTPEHHFKELYTTHKGNFKKWLGQTDSYLTWITERNFFHEGPITTLEVLSELPNAPPSFMPPVPLPPKDSYVVLDENIIPSLLPWMVSSRQSNVQRGMSIPEDEKTMRRGGRAEEAEEVRPRETEEVRKLITEEEPTMTLKSLSGGRTIFRTDSQSSEEGKHSAASSFEYTVLETCDGLLSPRTRSIPPRQPLKYACLLMSESGEESPPSSPNIYQNSPCGHFPAPVYSQC